MNIKRMEDNYYSHPEILKRKLRHTILS